MQGQKVVNKMITCAYKMNYSSNGSPLYPIPFDRVVACSDSSSIVLSISALCSYP